MKNQKVTRYLNNLSTGSGRRFRAIGHLGQAGGHGVCRWNDFSRFAEVADGVSYIASSADSGVGTEGTDNGYSDGIFSGDDGGSQWMARRRRSCSSRIAGGGSMSDGPSAELKSGGSFSTEAEAMGLLARLRARLIEACLPLLTSDSLRHHASAILRVFGVWIQPRLKGTGGRFPKSRQVSPEGLNYATVHKERERVPGVPSALGLDPLPICGVSLQPARSFAPPHPDPG